MGLKKSRLVTCNDKFRMWKTSFWENTHATAHASSLDPTWYSDSVMEPWKDPSQFYLPGKFPENVESVTVFKAKNQHFPIQEACSFVFLLCVATHACTRRIHSPHMETSLSFGSSLWCRTIDLLDVFRHFHISGNFWIFCIIFHCRSFVLEFSIKLFLFIAQLDLVSEFVWDKFREKSDCYHTGFG